MTVIALRQTTIETPVPIIEEVLTSDLFSRLKMQEYPILFLNGKRESSWSGFCRHPDHTESDEIVIDWNLIRLYSDKDIVQKRRFLALYLHECAHRLTPGRVHDAAFSAVCLVLYLRAGEIHDQPLFHWLKLYDLHDDTAPFPVAFAWAWRQAEELSTTDFDADECAKIICSRHEKWQLWLNKAPARNQEKQRQQTTKYVSLRQKIVFWKLAFFCLLAFSLTYIGSSSAHAQTEDVNAALDIQKATTFVWACDCIGGKPVWSMKSLKKIEIESNLTQAKIQRLMSTSQKIVSQPGGGSYKQPALDYVTASAIVSMCK